MYYLPKFSFANWLSKKDLVIPDKVAIIDVDQKKRLTYHELNSRVNRIANAFHERLKAKKGERIAVLSEMRAEYVEMQLAAIKLGVILVPLNSRLTEKDLNYIIDDCEPQSLIFTKHYKRIVELLRPNIGVKNYIIIDSKEGGNGILSWEELIKNSLIFEPKHEEVITLNDGCQICYTSGTTGFSKGAITTHGSMIWHAINAIVAWDLTSQDITLNVAPLFHVAGWCQIIPQLITGGTVILKAFQPEEALSLIEKERVTFLGGVSAIWLFMMQSPEFEKTDLRSLRLAWSGGAPLPKSVFDIYKKRGIILQQAYGLTEGPWVTGPVSKYDAFRKYDSIGRPLLFSDIRIVNSQGEDVAVGEVGELIFRGPHMTAGYWNRPEETKEAIRDGWFYTGDLVKMDEEGFIYIVDRKKDMYKSGGENVYPVEVENVLYSYHKVAEVAVIGVPDERWGEVGKAIVVPKPDQKITEEEIIEFCQGKLARYKIPRSVEFLDTLPRTPAGKVLKRELREKYWGKHEKRIYGGSRDLN